MSNYFSEIENFQNGRDASLRQGNGWLSVVGLFWLPEGRSNIGNVPDCDIPLEVSESIRLTVSLNNGQVNIISYQHGDLEESFTNRVFRHDQEKNPEVLTFGAVQIELLERKGKYGLRVRDANNTKLKNYPKLTWFDAQEQYRLNGRFIRHSDERTISVTIALGGEYDFPNPGKVVFELDGEEHSLEAVRQGNANSLFLIFKDKTNGKGSYGAGRFLFVPFDFPDKPECDVVIDFNKAISPPCAYTEAATCPLPPSDNHLSISIPAGERYIAS